ncbi:hypothetical protein ACB092_10G079300 [Castanea dentata]
MEAENEMRREKYVADISSIREAEGRIKSFIHKTPVLSSESLNAASGRQLFFKCECFQKSGNHAAALSLAAKLRGIPAYIVIPNGAPKCKVESVMRYGGQVIWSEATMQSRESVASKVLQETGAVLVHAHNDGRIISGQGTISLEFLEQAPQIDTLIAPISAGRIITLPETNTVADGLQAFLGDFTWPIVRDFVDDIITVEDNEIIEAMKLCYEILKVVVEPSGAIGLAAVLSDSFKNNPALKNCSNIGIILSGGNVDLGKLWDSYRK